MAALCSRAESSHVWSPELLYLPLTKVLCLQLQQSSRTELLRVLKVLDKALEPRTYLVGETLTLADIAVTAALLLPYKYVSGIV